MPFDPERYAAFKRRKEQSLLSPKDKPMSSVDFLIQSAGLSKDAFSQALNAVKSSAFEMPLANLAYRQASDPVNQQSLANALKMQGPPPEAGAIGIAVNSAARMAAPIAASLALPETVASVPMAGALRGAPYLLARGAGALAGAAEQGVVAGGTETLQNLLAGKGIDTSLDRGVDTAKGFAGGQLAGDLMFGSGPSMLKAIAKDAPRKFRQWFGLPEAVTEHVLKRGPSNVLTKANASEDTALNTLDTMREALVGQKTTAGEHLGSVEDAIVGTTAGRRMFDARGVAESIREELKRPIFMDVVKDYGGAAGEKAFLEKAANDLESGLITGEQLIGLRKNLDKMISFKSGPLPQPSTDLQRMVGNINNEIRVTLGNAYPETLGAAYKEYSQAADLYSRFRKPLGARNTSANDPDVFNDAGAIRKMRLAFEKGGKYQSALADFDNHVAKGQDLMQQFFDSIAAQEFAKGSPAQLSPSGLVMRLAASIGAMGPKSGGLLLKIAEKAGGPAGPMRKAATKGLQQALSEER